MKIGQRTTCLFCLTDGSFELRLDKSNRPYFVCVNGCAVKCFLRGDASLRGPKLLWGPLVIALKNEEAEVAQALVARAAEAANGNANR